MHEDSIAIVVIGVVELLLLASLSAVVLRRVRFPYTIGLVIVGILLAVAQDRLHVLTPIQHIRLSPGVVLYLFLPTLVFPAAVRLDLRLVRQNLSPILLLAGPGVILSTAIVGGVVRALTPLSWGAALLFGAQISASDPVAVMALFKDLKAPGRLSVLVDGESLLNDPWRSCCSAACSR
jgi:CPA1 family monovalent cation:H+ antiporter